jgi:16S rRNA A1518/A1519 N6-dimethyltransferase RsmA/KsgA/DIM1 with predicted DNA glycosylase/AP lyase activity
LSQNGIDPGELDRLKLILRTLSNLEVADLITFENCELALTSESDKTSLIASLPLEISSKVMFRPPLCDAEVI